MRAAPPAGARVAVRGRLKQVLGEAGVKRAWLFADQGVQPKLLDFYTDKCGFLSVQRDSSLVPGWGWRGRRSSVTSQ